jgi:hypothetical protein
MRSATEVKEKGGDDSHTANDASLSGRLDREDLSHADNATSTVVVKRFLATADAGLSTRRHSFSVAWAPRTKGALTQVIRAVAFGHVLCRLPYLCDGEGTR